MHHPVEANTIVKNAGATSNHDSIMACRLPGEAYPRAKVAQRYPVLRSEHAVKLADAWRKRTMSTLLYRPCIVVFWHDIAGKSCGVRERRRGRWYWNASQIACPLVGEITVFVREHTEALPPHAQIEGQFTVHLPVVLKESVLVTKQVTVNYAVDAASDAEQTGVKTAQSVAGRVSGIRRAASGVRRSATSAANQEIGERVHTEVAASQTAECQWPAHILVLVTGAIIVRSLSPGQLV